MAGKVDEDRRLSARSSEVWWALCRGAGADAGTDPDDDVLDAVERRWSEASTRWRGDGLAMLSCERFATGLGRGLRGRPQAGWAAAIDALQTDDLYLAAAASERDPAALRVVDGIVRQAAAIVAARMRDDAGDIAQLMRVRVLTAEEDGEARIAQFWGRGSLEAWLRVVGTRALLNTRRRRRSEPVPDAAFAEPITMSTPEVQVMRAESQIVFVDALRAAFERLDAEDRSLLEHSLVRRLNVTELGRELGVHHATAARWLVRARGRLLTRFHEELRTKMGDSQEAHELLEVLRSRAAFEDRELFDTDET